MVSAISTAITFVLISILYGLRIIDSVIWSTLAGNVISSIPAYNLNRRWTWGKRGKSHWGKEIAPFWMMTGLGIGASQLGALYARHEIHAHHWSHLVNTGLVAFTNLVAFAIFWVLKLILFNRIFRVNTLQEIDEELTIEETDADYEEWLRANPGSS